MSVCCKPATSSARVVVDSLSQWQSRINSNAAFTHCPADIALHTTNIVEALAIDNTNSMKHLIPLIRP
eukprot:5542216-Amphidinium_carterae.1